MEWMTRRVPESFALQWNWEVLPKTECLPPTSFWNPPFFRRLLAIQAPHRTINGEEFFVFLDGRHIPPWWCRLLVVTRIIVTVIALPFLGHSFSFRLWRWVCCLLRCLWYCFVDCFERYGVGRIAGLAIAIIAIISPVDPSKHRSAFALTTAAGGWCCRSFHRMFFFL
jgi:hypothetical protein